MSICALHLVLDMVVTYVNLRPSFSFGYEAVLTSPSLGTICVQPSWYS